MHSYLFKQYPLISFEKQTVLFSKTEVLKAKYRLFNLHVYLKSIFMQGFSWLVSDKLLNMKVTQFVIKNLISVKPV